MAPLVEDDSARASAALALPQYDIPIVIPAFNNPTYLENMITQLRDRGQRKLIVIDNASTYSPMLKYLQKISRLVEIVRLKSNEGPKYIFANNIIYNSLPNYFCVTDPDLQLSKSLPPEFMIELASLTGRFGVGKAGFSLDISERAALRTGDFKVGNKHYKIWEWEAQFWKDEVGKTRAGDPIFRASIDTTFAVYNKKIFSTGNFLSAVRVAGNYLSRHLPWYKRNGLSAKEEAAYRREQRFSSYLT